jgi:hypothetical protein
MSKQSDEWGVPDWRDASAYPQPDDLSAKRWRWEFVRRMPDYREAWDRAAPIEYENLCQQAKAVGRDASRLRQPNDLYFIVSSGTALTSADCYGLLKYGIHPMHNPRLQRPAIFEGGPSILRFNDEEPGGRATRPMKEYRQEKIRIRAGWTTVHFDLTQPLSEQLERARKLLEQIQRSFAEECDFASMLKQKASSRKRKKEWPRYLRVLDARNEGVSYNIIGQTIKGLRPDAATKKMTVQEADRYHDQLENARPDAKHWHTAAIRVANNEAA